MTEDLPFPTGYIPMKGNFSRSPGSLDLSSGDQDPLSTSNSSLDYSAVFDLFQPYLDAAKSFYLPVAMFFAIYVLGAVLMLPQFLRLWNAYKDQWGKLIEYPIINHAFHVIRKYYVVCLMLYVCLMAIFGYFLYSKLELTSFVLLIPAGILGIVGGVFTYIVGIFGEVYQIMIACEIFKPSVSENLTINEFSTKQMGKKKKIRNLYKVFLARDFLLIPALIIFDMIRAPSFDEMIANPEIVEDLVSASKIAGMIMSVTLSLAVPLATVSRLLKNKQCLENRPSQNLLHKITFAQGVIITVYVMVTVVVVTALTLFHVTPIITLTYTLQAVTAVLPLIIMSTTLVYCKKMQQEHTTKSIDFCKVEPEVVVVSSEKPPIGETH